MVSVASDINLMVWEYGVGYTGALLFAIAASFDYAAFELAYQERKNADLNKAAKAVRLYEAVQNEMLETLAFKAAIGTALFSEADNWSAAQWLALPDESRQQI